MGNEVKEETETYTCGLRFNPEPPKCGPAEFVEYDAGSFGNIKMHKFPELDRQTPLQEFLGERTQTRDYVLTEEEHKRFDAVEGCTPEEIEMAKKVLSKTLSKQEEYFTWKVYGGGRNTGINSNGVMNDPLLPEIQDRIDQIESMKMAIVHSLNIQDAKFGIPKE